MQINERIKELRIKNKLNQTQIAEILGMQQSQYARYETGKREFPLKEIVWLAKYYNISTDYILGLIDEERKLK